MDPATPPVIQQGSLLLADLSLHGSFFGRTVVLITSHEPQEGTQGFILNRPSEAGNFLEDLLSGPEFKALRKVPVFEGGPVSRSELMLIALRWNETTRRLENRAPLGIAGAVRALNEGWDVRAFLGYTGWSSGQLQEELEQSSWIVSTPSPVALKKENISVLWPQLLRSMDDPRYAILAEQPDDPSLN